MVCLIQGNKGNGQLYKPLKSFLLTERAIPSQIVLSGTINKRIYIEIFYKIKKIIGSRNIINKFSI